MQRHGFEIHDIFCSTPGNLSKELEVFHAVVGEVNEAVGMPHQALFAPLCLKTNNLIFIAGDAAKDNIRYCSFFVQILQDSWGPVGLFRELYDVAAACLKEDRIAVFVKPPASVEVPAGATVYHYETLESLESQMHTVLSGWMSSVLPQARDASA